MSTYKILFFVTWNKNSCQPETRSCQPNHEITRSCQDDMDRQTHKHIDLTCSWIWYHVDMICDLWTRWHDVLCVHTCKSCQHHIVSCVYDTSCRRSLVVQDHVFKSCTVDDHIVNTWWILWKHGWWVPYHLLSLSHVPHIMDTWYRDIMCRYEDISCVMCRYEGRAELSCACVYNTTYGSCLCLFNSSRTQMLHDHIFGARKVIQMWEIMSQWETCCWYTGIPALLGLGWDTSFRLPWLG